MSLSLIAMRLVRAYVFLPEPDETRMRAKGEWSLSNACRCCSRRSRGLRRTSPRLAAAGEGRPAGRVLAGGRRRGPGRRRLPLGRLPQGTSASAGRRCASSPAGGRRRRSSCSRWTRRSRGSRRRRARLAGRSPGGARAPVRPRDRARAALPRRACSRRAPPGRARGRDGRGGGAGGRASRREVRRAAMLAGDLAAVAVGRARARAVPGSRGSA